MAMVVATSLAVLLVDAADVEAPVRADGVGPR